MTMERLVDLRHFLNNKHGAQWYKVNLHVHAKGQNPDEIVEKAIEARISLIAITDHNTFRFVKSVQDAAKKRPEVNLVVLPGIEITLEEGAHILAIFDEDFDETKQTHFLGTLKIPLNGSDKTAVKDKTCSEVLTDITDSKGITVVPHPFSEDIGFLDKARKITTKMTWLESGNIGLIQILEDKVKFIGHYDGTWHNRYILASTPKTQISLTDYSLSPINVSEAKSASEIDNGCSWLKMGSLTVRGLRQVTCEPRTCISQIQPVENKKYKLLGLTVKGGFFDGLKIGFSSELTCIFGENHSGKTAVFDFISFALGRDLSVLSIDRKDEYDLLLRRLNAILQPDGEVNLSLKKDNITYN
uniref:AAA family ATPase n=1 Tax=Candidatus Wunengus californicus TaxID=3367619 RepID=UPI0040253184